MFEGRRPDLAAEVEESEDQLDTLNDAIKIYLTRLLGELSDDDSRRAIDIVTYTTNLEHVGDIIDKNLLELTRKMSRLKAQYPDLHIVIITGYPDSEILTKILASGPVTVIKKPIEYEQLNRTVKILGHKGTDTPPS